MIYPQLRPWSYGYTFLHQNGVDDKAFDDMKKNDELKKRIFAPQVHLDLLRDMLSEERIIKGVPFEERRIDNFRKQLLSPRDSGGRYFLSCNTGPKGSGKTVQLVQCMKVAAENGFLVFGVDFNA
eukprot:PhF_6_TR10051/c2_g2_i1/m.15488